MTKIPAILLSAALAICLSPVRSLAQVDSTQQVVTGRTNSVAQMRKPYIILISADGFRYDLADKYRATHLLELRQEGVTSSAMTPSFPSVTFPNHYTLITGLYPSHHGIVDNTFYDAQKKMTYQIRDREVVTDGSWYGGTPIWVLAEQQHMLTASFYWVGSEAAIQGTRPTYYYLFNDRIGIDDRIRAVKDWLTLPEEKRPHLITFYLFQVDHAEHMYGPDSKEAEEAVHLVDDCVGKLTKTVNDLHLPVSFIFVSDHGMTLEDTAHTLPLPPAVDTTKFLVKDGETQLHLYAKNSNDILPAYRALKAEAKDFDVYLPDETPVRWHYTKGDDRFNRVGDILLVSRFPRMFNIRNRKPIPGMHGFDNALVDMQASFYAWGPAFKQHWTTGRFDNVAVYPLLAKILGLTITEKIDGSLETLQGILR
jgi:predicted AlkP superfamily pyrophosphatase or phosphodiesterase